MQPKEDCKTPSWVRVDGVQVFSADFVFGQMQAQSSRIDRARAIAIAGLLFGIFGTALGIIAVLL